MPLRENEKERRRKLYAKNKGPSYRPHTVNSPRKAEASVNTSTYGGMKTCGTCNVSKPVEEFYLQTSALDGKQFVCKVCDRASTKEWADGHPERVKERNERWYRDNPERAKELSKKWYRDNPERDKEIHKKWRQDNPEKVKESAKKWRRNNPEQAKETARKASERWRVNNPERAKEIAAAASKRQYARKKLLNK